MAKTQKKARSPRSRLTHFEVRRSGALRLRLAIADDALPGVGDELGALLKKIAPSAVSTRTVNPRKMPTIVVPSEIDGGLEGADFVVSPQHEMDDAIYHAELRSRLTELFSSLCETSLEDALEIVRMEHARRAEGMN